MSSGLATALTSTLAPHFDLSKSRLARLAIVTCRFQVPLMWTLLDHRGNSNTQQRIALPMRHPDNGPISDKAKGEWTSRKIMVPNRSRYFAKLNHQPTAKGQIRLPQYLPKTTPKTMSRVLC